MKQILLFIFFVPLSITAKTQQINPVGNLEIFGHVIDAGSKLPLEKATVKIIGITVTSFIANTTTDSTGGFSFTSLQAGKYNIVVEYISFKTFSQNIQLFDGKPLTLDSILLISNSKILQTVIITGTKSLIENKTDRIVYNVEKDVSSQGGMATDILKKIPQITVDINGNVELLGNPSVRFLINGKPSAIFGNSIADALQSIPASQIQSIEVVSSPGAKYDATGTGGVINIILKKNKSQGFSGIVNFTAGTRLENSSINLNYKINNFSVSGYFSGSSQLKTQTITQLERNSTSPINNLKTFLHQDGVNDFSRASFRSGLGIDWDLTLRDNIGFSISQTQFNNKNIGTTDQFNSTSDINGSIINSLLSLRHSDTKFRNNAVETSIDYKHKLKKEKEEISISYAYSTANNFSAYTQSQIFQSNDSLFSGSQSKNPGKDELSTFSIDYTNPITKHFLLEIGYKNESQKLVSNSDVYSFSPVLYKYVFDDKQTYHSAFKRQINAVYVSGTFTLFKWLNLIAGSRYEYTTNKVAYSKSPLKIPNYRNFGPAITIFHKFQHQQTLKLSYAYRLERPEYRDLNPFVNLSDPHNVVTGNPLILPEIGNDFQLGYNQSFGQDNNLNIVLVYTYNSPDIKSYTTYYPTYKVGDSLYTDVNVTMRSNIASENRWGINISTSTVSFTRLTIRANIQLYNRITNNIYSTPQKISGFEYRGNLNINYQFKHGLIAEAFGNYNSGIHWQGRRAAFSSYTIAFRQPIFKSKGSIGLTAVNAFGKYLDQKSTQIGNGFTGFSLLRLPYRSFGISFMLKFGKIKISKPKEEENLLTKPPPIEN